MPRINSTLREFVPCQSSRPLQTFLPVNMEQGESCTIVPERSAKVAFAKLPLNLLEKGKALERGKARAMGFQKIQKTPLTDRLSKFAQNARDEAEKLEPGPERQALLEKARKAEAASEIESWANSPGLQRPR